MCQYSLASSASQPLTFECVAKTYLSVNATSDWTLWKNLLNIFNVIYNIFEFHILYEKKLNGSQKDGEL